MKGLITVLAVLVVLGVGFLLYSSPSAPPEMTEAEIAQTQAEVERAIADQWAGFRQAVLAGDYDGWASYWTPDVRILEPSVDLTGNEFFNWVREFFETGTEWHTFNVESLEVFVHGDAAYQIAQLDETATLGTGEPLESHVNLFARWLNVGGTWKIDRYVAGPREALPEGQPTRAEPRDGYQK